MATEVIRHLDFIPEPGAQGVQGAQELLSYLGRFGGKKILVLGDVGVDRYTQGAVERISPEAPVPIVAVDHEWLKLGLAANVAENIHALGGVPVLIGVIGEDRGAEDFLGMMKKSGMSSASVIKDGSRRTVLKERVVSERQQLLRIDYESTHPVAPKIRNQVLDRAMAALATADALVIEDYAKGLLSREITGPLIQECKKKKIPVLVDPNPKSDVEIYQDATLLTPNRKEAEGLLRGGFKISDESSLIEAGNRLLELLRVEHIVITLGKDGMVLFTRGSREAWQIPTFAREVYDVSGAGDTVVSVLALALVGGASLNEAAILANLAAGIVVSKRGTATVTQDEIRRYRPDGER